jgi:two-component system, sensor histidine kinase and response regulator
MMKKQPTLFHHEELALQKSAEIIKQFEDKKTVPLDAYEQLTKNYKKLLKQTKLLIKMSDKQQNYLTHLADKIEVKNQELIQLNQEKTDFLGIAAHDLKNPLSTIQGVTNFIQGDFDNLSKDEIIEWINTIEQTSRQMFDLIKNFLDLTAIESGKFNISLVTTDISLIAQFLINHYQSDAQAKHLSLHLQTDDNEESLAFVDKNAIYQVLDNLISNAIKYSPHGKNIYIRFKSDSEQMRCEIEDEGPGLSESEQKLLFTKFARLSSLPTGDEHSTGLGLYIAKKLVDAMNGKIWCETQLEQGAIFIVTFPINSNEVNPK